MKPSASRAVAIFPALLLMFALLSVPSARASPSITVFYDDLTGFNENAISPPIVISFDNIAAGTNITGTTIAGVTFEQEPGISSAPLIVVRANDTHPLPGYTTPPAPTNRLFATSGANVLSPGGVDLAPGPNATFERDNMVLNFTSPVYAVGFDVLFEAMDSASFVLVKALNETGATLYSQYLPTDGNGTWGGSAFVGFFSTASNIKKIIIDDQDNNNAYMDNNIGLDTIRLRVSPPTAPSAPRNLQEDSGEGFVNLTWEAPSSDGGSPITNYQVLRGTSAGNEVFYANAGTHLWFRDTGVTNGQTYYYKVIANNSVGAGASTGSVGATPSTPSPSSDNTLLYIGIIAILLIAALLLAFFLMKRRKKKT